MTYPHIGNYGINSHDMESAHSWVEGFLVRELSPLVSNWMSEGDLDSFLKKHKVIGLEGIDTRKLTRKIRINGAMRGCISTKDFNPENILKKVLKSDSIAGLDLASKVSCKKPYIWSQGDGLKIAVWDCGVKESILNILSKHNCFVKVYPVTAKAQEILKDKPDAVVLSNGPGDPEPVTYLIEEVKNLMHKLPILGICLGHQILCLAMGGATYKLKFGHHGGNHPVKNLENGLVKITAHNHGFSVNSESIKDSCEITHINLYDNTVEGMRHRSLPIMGIQYHPEAGPGPNDSKDIFDEFLKMIGKE